MSYCSLKVYDDCLKNLGSIHSTAIIEAIKIKLLDFAILGRLQGIPLSFHVKYTLYLLVFYDHFISYICT